MATWSVQLLIGMRKKRKVKLNLGLHPLYGHTNAYKILISQWIYKILNLAVESWHISLSSDTITFVFKGFKMRHFLNSLEVLDPYGKVTITV